MGLCFSELAPAAREVRASEQPDLSVLTYDSIVAEGGLGSFVFDDFRKLCKCKVGVIASGDAAQMVARVLLDAKRGVQTADVIFGVDQNLFLTIADQALSWGDWMPRGSNQIKNELWIQGPHKQFLPFDFGYFAMMVDQEELKKRNLSLPTQVEQLVQPRWRRNFILEDPRSSAPGLAFLLFTQKVMGEEGFSGFWKNLRGQWLSIASGWDQAYGLFLKKEAPMVWSYTTSEAYHREKNQTHNYRSVLLEGEALLQVEGLVIHKDVSLNPRRERLAKEFLEFMISRATQSRIATTQWMYPASSEVKLPPSFDGLPQPKNVPPIRAIAFSQSQELIKKWLSAIQ